MKLYKKKENKYCIDCDCNLMGFISIFHEKIKIFTIEISESFPDGYRCKTCAKNYKERVHKRLTLRKK